MGIRLLRTILLTTACLLLSLVTVPIAARERASPDGLWLRVEPEGAPGGGRPWIQPLRYEAMSLDVGRLEAVLAQAPLEVGGGPPGGRAGDHAPDALGDLRAVPGGRVADPRARTPGGVPLDPLLPGLGGRRPVGEPPRGLVAARLRRPGAHAGALGRLVRGFPLVGRRRRYATYSRTDLVNDKDFACGVEDDGMNALRIVPSSAALTLGTQLRTFRIAFGTSREYGNFFVTRPLALAALNRTVNRMTGIYEIDVAVRLTLVGARIYPFDGADPYRTPPCPPGAPPCDASLAGGTAGWAPLQTDLDTNIGAANYDIGHLVGQGGSGGVACGGGCVCAANKASGTTNWVTPQGDTFDIDYVAHEVGHQFGARHTWNGTAGSCSAGQWSAGAAMEPGGGHDDHGLRGDLPARAPRGRQPARPAPARPERRAPARRLGRLLPLHQPGGHQQLRQRRGLRDPHRHGEQPAHGERRPRLHDPEADAVRPDRLRDRPGRAPDHVLLGGAGRRAAGGPEHARPGEHPAVPLAQPARPARPGRSRGSRTSSRTRCSRPSSASNSRTRTAPWSSASPPATTARAAGGSTPTT